MGINSRHVLILILNLDIVLISADFGKDRIMKGQFCLLEQLEGDTGK